MKRKLEEKLTRKQFIEKLIEEVDNIEDGDELQKTDLDYRQMLYCKICCVEYSKHLKNSKHLNHDHYYNCTLCYKSFKADKDYIIHTASHTKNKLFICVHCDDYKTKDFVELSNHLTTPHEARYACVICYKIFTVESWYKEHFNIHKKLEPFDCKHCDKKFPFSRYLAAHIAVVHADTLPLSNLVNSCVLCGKIYRHKRGLYKHMSIIHSDNKLMCEVCGIRISEKNKLDNHMRTHTGYKPCVCSYCGKRFPIKQRLQEHERTHTGERPFVCDVCGKGFTQKNSLVIHKRNHAGIKPYQCHICQKKFLAKSMLNVHLKRKCTGPKDD